MKRPVWPLKKSGFLRPSIQEIYTPSRSPVSFRRNSFGRSSEEKAKGESVAAYAPALPMTMPSPSARRGSVMSSAMMSAAVQRLPVIVTVSGFPSLKVEMRNARAPEKSGSQSAGWPV